MNKKGASILAFVAGAAIGSVVTWKIVKTKYEQITQEEIDSVKEAFSCTKEKLPKASKVEVAPLPFITATNDAYESLTKDLGYTSSSEEKPHVDNKDIYVIPPEAAGECDYEIVTLTYYADDVLTDEADEIISNPDVLIGPDSLKCFGEYEDDSVFVRNDKLKIDYEVLMDMRNYSEVTSRTSSPVSK